MNSAETQPQTSPSTRTPIAPSTVRFIKLGSGGGWERDCIEGPDPCIRFGFNNPEHETCLKGDWEKLRSYWTQHHPKKATMIVNATRDFYALGADTLWITFYQRKLWWCFAEPKVDLQPDGSRARRA